ncbi:hypothetical protein CW304_21510 [Bacillus sp. UFRGS-B20]|nr:hypothetical protein CW304_21510 [Bacillus sp. UFRGS-B20]
MFKRGNKVYWKKQIRKYANALVEMAIQSMIREVFSGASKSPRNLTWDYPKRVKEKNDSTAQIKKRLKENKNGHYKRFKI